MANDKVIFLIPIENISCDSSQLVTIYRDLGTDAANQVVTRAVNEIAVTMSSIVELFNKAELEELPRKLRRMQAIAENLGISSLASVSSNLRECIASNDSVAFAAVWARLLRVVERSLTTEANLLGSSNL